MNIYKKSLLICLAITSNIFASQANQPSQALIVYEKPYLQRLEDEQKELTRRTAQNMLDNCRMYNPKLWNKFQAAQEFKKEKQAAQNRAAVSLPFMQTVIFQATNQATEKIIIQETTTPRQKISNPIARRSQNKDKEFLAQKISKKHYQTQEIIGTKFFKGAHFYNVKDLNKSTLSTLTTIMTQKPETDPLLAKKHPSNPELSTRITEESKTKEEIVESKSDESLATYTLKKPACKTVAIHTIAPQYNHKAFANIDTESLLDKKILFYVAHGTFSNAKSFGESEIKPLTQELLEFGQKLALASSSTVELQAIEWSGELSQIERVAAGQELAQRIIHDLDCYDRTGELRKNGKLKIMVLGHSHGGNVIHNAAQHLKTLAEEFQVDPKLLEIDNGIFISTPVLDIDPLQSKNQSYNIKRIVNMYGDSDMTGSLGSAVTEIAKGQLPTFTLEKKYPTKASGEKLVNIVLKDNGLFRCHIGIKIPAVRSLPLLFHLLDDSAFIAAQSIFTNLLKDADTQKLSLLTTINTTSDPSLEKNTFALKPDLTPAAQELLLKVIAQSAADRAKYKQLYHEHKLTDIPSAKNRVLTEVTTAVSGYKSAKYTTIPKNPQVQTSLLHMSDILTDEPFILIEREYQIKKRQSPSKSSFGYEEQKENDVMEFENIVKHMPKK
jgi:hypothetical protein